MFRHVSVSNVKERKFGSSLFGERSYVQILLYFSEVINFVKLGYISLVWLGLVIDLVRLVKLGLLSLC